MFLCAYLAISLVGNYLLLCLLCLGSAIADLPLFLLTKLDEGLLFLCYKAKDQRVWYGESTKEERKHIDRFYALLYSLLNLADELILEIWGKYTFPDI